jgi:hypothetical protein
VKIIEQLNNIVTDAQTKPLALKYPQMQRDSLSLAVFCDAAFAEPLAQLRYIMFLRDATGRCCVLDYRSYKCRRVARSVLSAELIAFAGAYDRGYAMAFDLSDMLGHNVPLKLYTDSKGLFDVITRGSNTTERRLQIDIAFAREGFNRGWIKDVVCGVTGGRDWPS